VISVIIPAYNEEKLLPATLDAVRQAIVDDSELIVVDNESTDKTREIASAAGALIINAATHNIAHVRNVGANEARGDVLVFLDADTFVKPGVFEEILTAISDQDCLGGSVRVEYEAPLDRFWMRSFMKLWVMLGKLLRMRQGALQFSRRDIFRELNGYDETIYVGEDIEFHWRLDKLARRRGGRTHFVEAPAVTTSSRRWNQMGLARMFFFTHPITIFLAWRTRSFWKDWYERAIR